MIDKIDRMILDKICQDANISNVKLAEAIHLSTATVARRIKTMLEGELITIRAVPNLPKIGYRARAMIALNVDLMSIDKLRVKLIEEPNIYLAVTTFGRYDILMSVDSPDWDQLNTFVRYDLAQWPGVKQINVFSIAETKKIHRHLFGNGFGTNPPMILDDIDNKLVQELRNNGITKYKDIAHKLGIDSTTVSRRVNFLLEENIIKIMALPDPLKFGYSANAFIMLGTDHGKADEICTEVNNYPEIDTSMILTVGFDILAIVQFLKPAQLYEFIRDKVSHIRGISTIETLIVAEYIKSVYTWVDFDSIP